MYLTDEIAVLALFDDDMDEITKLKMVANLHRENFWTHEKRYIPSKEELCGSFYGNQYIGQYLSVQTDSFSNPSANRRLEEAVADDWDKMMKFEAS
ncbi:hypothetical protein AVEN_192687-1 [Araneus ventricosus]|uniref:Uncharacterized protein n=1 Tax=Araneus ventricosus TaxID=182803 RepID=A0A4Y2HU60_ARAVE|nr:hypothetical protein AVEN_192687-1 [Araneus ventricosus]